LALPGVKVCRMAPAIRKIPKGLSYSAAICLPAARFLSVMITFGNTSIEISLMAVLAAILTAKLLFIIAGIWLVVQGFRVHWGWGVANLSFTEGHT
jgi:hypothetical protein